MKILTLIVDDEPLARTLLQKHTEQVEFIEVIGTCGNAIKALEILNSQPVDLLFLDIKMPQISGLDLLKTLSKPPKTILTTAHREFALDGFDLGVIDYLLKPITFDRFFKAIERFLQNNNPIAAPIAVRTPAPTSINIKSGNKFFKLNPDDILYAESIKDYIKIHTKEKAITAKYKISDLEKDLTDKGFLRIHRSFIVNLKNITAFTPSDIEIGNIEIPIGESYKEYVYKSLNTL